MKAVNHNGSTPSRILVRGVNWVGDTIMSLPAAKALRRMFPSAHLAFWVPDDLEPLVRLTRIPDEIITFNRKSHGPLRRALLMRSRLSQGHFDMAVLFQNAFESAFTCWLSGIRLRAGYPTDLRGPLLNIRAPMVPSVLAKHQVYYYLEIGKYLDSYFRLGRFQYNGEPNCSIKLPGAEIEKARRLISDEGLSNESPLVCLCPGSVNSDAKRWPAEYYSRLADLLAQQHKTQIIFLGAPQERSLIDGIIRGMKNGAALNLAAKSDIVMSLAIMSLSDLVISNDTGSAHLSVAAGAKTLTIFGPTIAGATAPFGTLSHIIQGKARCAPCGDHDCRQNNHACMRNLIPEIVAQKASEIMALPRTV